MILQETVLVALHRSNIQLFESLGYSIPKYKDKYYRMSIKRGTKIKVKVSDLPKGSHNKVLCKCDMCGKERFVIYKQYRNFCHKCIMKTEETKNNCSKSSWLKGKTGKLSPFYNSNLTDKERKQGRRIVGMTKWRKEVKQRDNHTCQKCGYIGKPNDWKTVAHHINNFSNFKELRTDVENGITLCNKCHKEIHKQFGPFTTKENLICFQCN